MQQPGQILSNRKRKIFRWVKVFIIVYCSIGIAVYYLQDAMLLHPVKISAETAYQFDMPFTEVNVPYDAGTNISIIQFHAKNDTPGKGLILYFHGNRNNIKRYQRFVPNLTRRGYEVWMIDYPGFGKSTGNFTEQMVYEWSLLLYKMARKKYAADSITLYGKSLGSGIAAQLASIRDCRRLILETPYYSITSLADTYLWMYPTSRMIHYKIPTNEYLKKITAPVTIFHGTADGVIPYRNAVKLKSVLKAGDEFITVEGGSHRNLNTYPLMYRKLDSLLKR